MNINGLSRAAAIHAFQKNNHSANIDTSNDKALKIDRYIPSDKTSQNENTYTHLANKSVIKNKNEENSTAAPAEEKKATFADLRQALLDHRLGIDRDKIVEIEALIEELQKAIASLPSDDADNSNLKQQLADLFKQLEQEYQKGTERMREQDNDAKMMNL